MYIYSLYIILTNVISETEVTPPVFLIHEGCKRINISPADPTPHNSTGINDWTLLE